MVIVDTSVVFKWFDNTEEYRELAKKILQRHIVKKDEITILDLLLYEITNVWSTKTKAGLPTIRENLLRLERYSLHVVPVSFALLKRASQFAEKYKVSVYDASYAVLAVEKKCKLVTADAKFVEQVNLPFVKNLTEYS